MQEEELQALLNQQKRHFELIEKTKQTISGWAERGNKREIELARQKKQREYRESGENITALLYNICAFSGALTKEAIEECMSSLRY